MKTDFRCFAGANTENGFVSGFDGIFENRKRVFYIKGAPGTGKSGFMKRVARRQLACGHAVSAFFCSSDPDSLDGIADETTGCAIFDATPPHAYDPIVPGARDELLSFADYLDAEALLPDRAAIEQLQTAISAEYKSARLCLSAAARAWEASPAPADARRERAAAKEILSLLPPPRAKAGREKRFFLSAHTWKGSVSFEEQFAPENTVSIPTPFGGSADGLLRRVDAAALEAGLDTILFLDPISPSRAAHLFVPGANLFVTNALVPARKVFGGLFEAAKESDPVFEQAVKGAHMHLKRAKALHDELESVYIPRMNFSRLTELEARVYRAFDRAEEEP